MNDVMNEDTQSPRIQLIRDSAVLQAKLLVDGFRDALLIPVALVATLIGVLRGGEDCQREFRAVIGLGRRSERWIDLFGTQQPLNDTSKAGSMDSILSQVESIVVEQYRKGRNVSEAREAVRQAMKEHEPENQ